MKKKQTEILEPIYNINGKQNKQPVDGSMAERKGQKKNQKKLKI